MVNIYKKGVIMITILCMFLGFIMSKIANDDDTVMLFEMTSVKRVEDLIKKKESLESEKNRLEEIAREYEASIAEFEDQIGNRTQAGFQLTEELWESRLLAGLTNLEGPGVEIILNDRKRDNVLSNNPSWINFYIVHDIDVLNVINELRAAGAEAISINGVRIMATSRISCGGPTINVGRDQRFAPPFVIHGIGDPDAIIESFNSDDSVFNELLGWGLEVSIRRIDNIEIPRYYGDVQYNFAKPVKEGE